LGPVADRADGSDTRGGRNIDGLAGLTIRARIESRNHLTLRHVAAIQIGLIGTVGLLLAALHGIEAVLWAAYIFAMMQAYWSLMTRGRPH